MIDIKKDDLVVIQTLFSYVMFFVTSDPLIDEEQISFQTFDFSENNDISSLYETLNESHRTWTLATFHQMLKDKEILIIRKVHD